MSDLTTILPNFNPPNERLHTFLQSHGLTTVDLLSRDTADILRHCTGPRSSTAPSRLEIERFVNNVSDELAADTPFVSGTELKEQETYLSTGDARIDALLGGGVAVGGITEFVGESGAGKTQFLLAMALTAQLPPSLGGLGRGAVYISTEAPLSTPRLVQIATSLNKRLAPNPAITTDKVLSITCNDLEAQEHILRYQLPVTVARHNIGLVVIDSIAANFRAEMDRPAVKRAKMSVGDDSAPAQLARRRGELVVVAQGLRELARRYRLAIVVANQVSDRFAGARGGEDDVWSLDYQSQWFTGWDGREGGKVPALGVVWANLLAARVVLRKADEGRRLGRRVGVVFAGWVKSGEEIEYEIWEGGVRGVEKKKAGEDEGGNGQPSIYS